MKTLIFSILISFTFSQVSLNYYIRQDSVFIGDIVNFIIELDVNPSQVPIFPDLQSENESMSVGNKLIGEKYVEYELTFWEVGKGIIPQIPIQIMENNQIQFTLETDSLEVQIFSSISQNESTIRDIKGMKEVEIITPLQKLILIFCIIFGIIIAIFLWRKRKNKVIKKRTKKKYIEPIHIQTLKSLEKLEIEYPINWENAEKYYLELTYIFRKYLAEIFYFKALEMTTNEILDFFKNKHILLNENKNDMVELLNRADLSKYAMHIPDKDYFNSDKSKAIALVKVINEKFNKSTNG